MKKLLLVLSLIACTFLLAQESLTKKYLNEDNLESAKNFAKIYNESVLAKKYTITNIGNPETNNYDVEYKVKDVIGSVVSLVNFNFRERDFTVTLKSIKYLNNKTGEISEIKEDSTVKDVKDYYELTKRLLVTLQANYIAPDLD